jgi:hypothetical protein
VADRRFESSVNVPSRWITSPRSDSVFGAPAAALGMITVLPSVVSVFCSDRAPGSLFNAPELGSVSFFSSPATEFSASTRSDIAVEMALVGSEKPIVVGEPALVPVSLSVRPGAASVMVLDARALHAVQLEHRVGRGGGQARKIAGRGPGKFDRPGSEAFSDASRTKPLAAPSLPLSTSCAPLEPFAT